MKKIFVSLLVLVLALACLPASAEGNTMKFDRTVNVVFEGETLQTVLTREGDPATGEVSYQCNNTKVATVDANGVVTGLTRGRTTLTATVKTAKRTYRTQLDVTVARRATEVTVATEKLPVYAANDPLIAGLLAEGTDALPVLVIPVRKSYNLQTAVLPKDATNRKTVLTSGNENVLRVRNGSVTGMAPGETLLTVANELSPEVKKEFRVLVVEPVTRLTAEASAPTVAVGESITVKASVVPAGATLQRVVWSSGNEQVAKVDADGNVTGVKRGNARIIGSATDGSGVRVNLNIRVTQKAESITLDKPVLTIDVGRSGNLRATVLPRDTDDKKVTWSSSDESVATVNSQGRITAVSLGTCRITCTSQVSGNVSATAEVTVQQPVKKIVFDPVPEVWLGSTAKLTWSVEPANATNPAIALRASDTRILTVAEDGTVTPNRLGETYVTATSTDGSNRTARVRVKTLQHVEGVHMRRRVAYVDVREGSTTSAVLEPENASNQHMTWVSADPSIAEASGERLRVKIVGRSAGETTVTGTTEDGGFQTSILVRIGDWDHALKLRDFRWDNGKLSLQVRNNSELNITRVTAEIAFFELDGTTPVTVNAKDGSNVVNAVWKKGIEPGDTTGRTAWQLVNYKAPENLKNTRGVITLTSFEIDHDWIKTIRKNNRPHKEW